MFLQKKITSSRIISGKKNIGALQLSFTVKTGNNIFGFWDYWLTKGYKQLIFLSEYFL